jgi:type IV secretion system protein VirB6
MDVTIAQDVYQAIDAAMKSTLGTGTAKVMLGLGASFGSMWLVHFTLKSIYWLFQGMDAIFQEVIFSIFKMAFIMYFAFNVDWYINTVVPFVTGLPNWMGGILSGLEGPQVNQVDALIKSYIESFIKLTDGMKFGWRDDWGQTFNVIVAMGFYLVGGIPFLSMCVGTMMVLKFSTSIILVVGPIFIAFALFDPTRQWFWGWVSTLSGFMLTYVFFAVAIGIETNYINNFIMVNGDMDISLMGAFEILIVFGAFTLLATQLPGYAAAIMGGGSSGGVTGVGGVPGAGGAARLAGGGARKMGGALTAAIGKRMNRNRIE